MRHIGTVAEGTSNEIRVHVSEEMKHVILTAVTNDPTNVLRQAQAGELADLLNKAAERDGALAVSTESIQVALNAATRCLNAANDAVNYADSALSKAHEAQRQATIAVRQLEVLVQAAWNAERTGLKVPPA